MSDLSEDLIAQIERFFVSSNEAKRKKFELKRRSGKRRALALVKAAMTPPQQMGIVQSSLALCTLMSVGFLIPGRVIRWRPVGRIVFVKGRMLTGFPDRADS